MNTVEKGNKFEIESKKILQRVIKEGHLSLVEDHIKIFEKKEYYSSERKSNIEFDITIEVWPPNAKRYSMIYVIECKNYNSRVPVEKIERFRDQIKQFTGINAKAIFITNSPLQKSAFNVAEAAGMMLIQGESSDNYKIILHKTNRETNNERIPFIKSKDNNETLDEGILIIEKMIDKQILDAIVKIEDENFVSNGIDRLSKIQIQQKAKKQLDLINSNIISHNKFLGLKTFKNFLEESLNLTIYELDTNSKLLGCADFENQSIGLSKNIIGTNREFFILAHEFGHFILHYNLSIGQYAYNSFSDSEYNLRTSRHKLNNDKNWIEWQANYFAASLIMPNETFFHHLTWCQRLLKLPIGKIFIDDQSQNIRDFMKLLEKLAYVFDVSSTTIKYKLQELQLINNQSSVRSVGEIIDTEFDFSFI